MAWAPAPACTTSVQYEAGLVRKYVCVDCVVCGVNCTARTPCVEDNEAIQPTVQQASAKNGTKPAQVYMCFCVTDQHYCVC